MNSSTSQPAASLGRGRPRSLQKAEAILLAACQNFGREGYLNARVSNIARDAGVTKVTIYSWYDGKLGLYRAALRRMLGALPSPTIVAGELGLDLEDDMKQMGCRLTSLVTSPEVIGLRRMLDAHGAPVGVDGPRAWSELVKSYQVGIESSLQSAYERGLLGSVDCRLIASVLIRLAVGDQLVRSRGMEKNGGAVDVEGDLDDAILLLLAACARH